MHITLFRALKDANIADDAAEKVVHAFEEHIDMAISDAMKHYDDRITAMQWNAFPASLPTEGEHQPEWSFVSVVGEYADAGVRLKVFGTPPEEVGPGMRQRSDGSWEPV